MSTPVPPPNSAAAGNQPQRPRGLSPALEFERFVSTHDALFRRHLASALRGNPDIDDALQRGLLRIWREWQRWPTDPATRRIYALRTLRFAAKDQLRDAHRDARRAQPFDFSQLDDPQAESSDLLTAVRQALAAGAMLADHETDEPGLRDAARAALRCAEGALTPQERRVLRLSARGLNLRQIANRIGLSHQRVRIIHMNARTLVETLAAHQLGIGPTADEIAQLTALQERRLAGRSRHQLRRHYDACATCQSIVAINGRQRVTPREP